MNRNGLDSIGVHPNEPESVHVGDDPWPLLCDNLIECLQTHISNADVNDTRRGLAHHGTIREIGILGDNDQAARSSVLPNLGIRPCRVEITNMDIVIASP